MGARGRSRSLLWLMFLLTALALLLAGTLAFVVHPAPASSQQTAMNGSNATSPADRTKSAEALGEGVVTQLLVRQYNDSIAQVPGILTGIVSGKRVQVRILRTDGPPVYYYVRTDSDGRITDYYQGRGPRPTIRVITDAATLERAIESNTPGQSFTRAYDEGRVRLEGVGVVGKIQVLFLKAVIAIVRLTAAI